MCYVSIALCRQRTKGTSVAGRWDVSSSSFHTEAFLLRLVFRSPPQRLLISFCPVTTRSQTWWFDKDGQVEKKKKNVKFHDVVVCGWECSSLLSVSACPFPAEMKRGRCRIPDSSLGNFFVRRSSSDRGWKERIYSECLEFTWRRLLLFLFQPFASRLSASKCPCTFQRALDALFFLFLSLTIKRVGRGKKMWYVQE